MRVGSNAMVLFRQRVAGPSLTHGEQALSALLDAFELLNHRGDGREAWASPFRDNALAFLLDTMGDATNLWDPDGRLLYRNRAAQELGLGQADDTGAEELFVAGRRFQRRTAQCSCRGRLYMLEVLREA
jgi:hypothetical protein